jgi:hypothetical protein
MLKEDKLIKCAGKKRRNGRIIKYCKYKLPVRKMKPGNSLME